MSTDSEVVITTGSISDAEASTLGYLLNQRKTELDIERTWVVATNVVWSDLRQVITDQESVVDRLEAISDLGANVLAQAIKSSVPLDRVEALMDLAADAGLRFTPVWYRQQPAITGGQPDLGPLGEFLEIYGRDPRLGPIQVVDEPGGAGLSPEDVLSISQAVRRLTDAPRVLGTSKELDGAGAWELIAGTAEIIMISGLHSRAGNTTESLVAMHRRLRPRIQAIDPGAAVISNIQTAVGGKMRDFTADVLDRFLIDVRDIDPTLSGVGLQYTFPDEPGGLDDWLLNSSDRATEWRWVIGRHFS